MADIVPRSKTKRWLGGLLGAFAGIWGVVVILAFGLSQVRMITPDTPLGVVLGSDGLGLTFLVLQLIGYAASAVIAVLAGGNRVRILNWLRLMLLLSLAFFGLSVIPF